jgi:hypothetical protein
LQGRGFLAVVQRIHKTPIKSAFIENRSDSGGGSSQRTIHFSSRLITGLNLLA